MQQRPICLLAALNGRTQPTGSDVELTLGALGLPAAGDLSDHARKLLTGWRYEFGSEGYITCLHDKDAAYPEDEFCERASAGWLRRRLAFGVGPAFNVWARRRTDRCVEVSIVFRGTAGLRDFISNGRRYTGWAADEAYQQLSRNVDAIVGRVAKMNCFRKRTQIVAVGHSLGAGLAEFSAFARKGRPRITKVFAFDPSSETGEGLIDPATLNANVKGNRKGRGLRNRYCLPAGRSARTAAGIRPSVSSRSEVRASGADREVRCRQGARPCRSTRHKREWRFCLRNG